MAKPYPTVATQLVNRNPNRKKKPNPRPATLTLSVPFTDIPNDPANQINYTFAVLRQGGNTGVSDAIYAVVPAAGSGIPASYFGGSYPTGPVHFVDGQGQQTCIISVPAGPDLAADTFADIVLSGFVNCDPGAITDVTLRAPGVVVVPDYIVSVSMPVVSLTRDPVADQSYAVVVTRTRVDGNYSQSCSVQLTAVGSGTHPFSALDFTGGLLNTPVSFAAGETSKTFQIIVKAGALPATDLTGNVMISAPFGCVVNPVAASVAVAIPAAVGALPVVSVAVPDPTWDRAGSPQNYTINVSRAGSTSGTSSVALAVTGTGANPMTAADFTGGLLSTTVNFAIGETGPKASTVQVVAGAPPANDATGQVALSSPVGCTISPTAGIVAVSIPKAVVVPDYIVSVAMPIVVLTRDDLIDEAYSVAVTRVRADGDYSQSCSVQLMLTGSGANPIQGSDITGGLLNTTVNFGAGDTEKDFTIVVKAGADPATDLTGDVAISAPSGCKISPTAASVAVKIPQAVVIVPNVLPPEYLDPDFTHLVPYGAACTSWSQVQTQCAALSNNALCKTKYVKLAASYVDTVSRNFNYKGYVDPVTGLIYPLIVTGDITKANSRATADITNRPHFNAGTMMNGAVWMWLYALAAEYPFSGGFQPNTAAAVNMDNSTDCLVTRCWLDAPCAVMSGGSSTAKAAIRPRVGGNDCYGTWNGGTPQPWTTKLRFVFSGKTTAAQDRTLRAYIYQNFLGNCRAPFEPQDHTCCFYAGEGLSPALSEPVDYPNVPYDLNWRESWFFNNLIISTANYLIYNKHACNIWRNRAVSISNWTDITGTGVPFHLIACRGGNWTGGTVKYNVVEASGGHSDFQSWWGVAEFNDWGGQDVNIFIHCNDPSRLSDGRFSKTLLAASHWRFRSNKNGKYQIGTARPDAGYQYYAPMLDTSWEGEINCTWNWEVTYTIIVNHVSLTTVYNPSGTPVAWGANGKNTETGQIKLPGDTFKTVAAPGQLTKSGTSTAVRQLTDATAANGFTKAEKGIVSQEGLVWDGIGTGNAGGGGGGSYDLVQSNFTLHFPSDNMATDYPNVAFSWLAGGGFECKAGRGSLLDSPHVCLRMWLKTAPPTDAATFTFYYTRLDNLAASDAEGIFSLFTERYKGAAAYGADPNGWAKTSWRTHPSYISGSDLLYRERGTGYRHSFANRSQTASSAQQFRLRTYNAAADGGTQIFDTTGYTADNVNGGNTFEFPLNVKCKVAVVRTGNALVCKRTRMDTGVIQEWDFNDPLLGTGGRAPGGWCGFGFYLGAWGRVEPVPGVPFVQ